MNTPPSEYKPIPVEVARKIAEAYDKSTVIIIAYDPLHQVFHHSTYGVSAEDKVVAANMGESIADMIADTPRSKFFEDFRDLDAAKAKVQIDAIQQKLDGCRSALAKHWLALRSLAEACDLAHDTSMTLKAAGADLGVLTLGQILEEGAEVFGGSRPGSTTTVETTFTHNTPQKEA